MPTDQSPGGLTPLGLNKFVSYNPMHDVPTQLMIGRTKSGAGMTTGKSLFGELADRPTFLGIVPTGFKVRGEMDSKYNKLSGEAVCINLGRTTQP